MYKLEIRLCPSLGLSVINQRNLSRIWDNRVADPLAFIPHEFRDVLTPKEAMRENLALGDFGINYLRSELLSSKFSNEEKIVAVGYGKGYDSLWLKEATEAGLATWWIDVSETAYKWATRDVQNQWRRIGMIGPSPTVKQGEIRSVLANPSSVDLDTDSIVIWYSCRTLGCLSRRSAKIVLQKMGESLGRESDPLKNHKIITINALRDDNPSRVGKTCSLPSEREILSNIRRGSGRTVKIYNSSSHYYFDQKYRAITIMAE